MANVKPVRLLPPLLCVALVSTTCDRADRPLIPQDEDTIQVEGIEGANHFEWALGPIRGLTTVWHPVPPEITVPVGAILQLKCGGSPGADVRWAGVGEIRTVADGSIAEFRVEAPGRREITVEVIRPNTGGGKGGRDGGIQETSTFHSCVVHAVSASVRGIAVRSLELRGNPLYITDESTNFETMRAFAGESIARVRRTGPNEYLAGVQQYLALDVDLTDDRFASLIEARVAGHRPVLVENFAGGFQSPGRYVISVGPPGSSRQLVVNTYAVTITSHQQHRDPVPEGVPVTFVATTDPAGYEGEITWISSTLYGSATPVVGQGRTFTTRFVDTWGPYPYDPNTMYRWLGVRADNAAFSDDVSCSLQNMTFVNHIVIIDESNFTPVTVQLNGTMTVNSASGDISGTVTAGFGAPSVTANLIAGSGSDFCITIGANTLDLLPTNVDSVVVNGVATSAVSVINSFVSAIASSADPSTWSFQAKALLALVALSETTAYEYNSLCVQQQTTNSAISAALAAPSSVNYCKGSMLSATSMMGAIASADCQDLAAKCPVASATVVFGGMRFNCTDILALCTGSVYAGTTAAYSTAQGSWSP